MSSTGRTILAGLAGGTAMNVSMFLTFRLLGFGWNGDGILITSPLQSRKLVAVWTEIEPLPLIVTNPLPMIIGLTLFGVGHAVIYKWLAPSWPGGIVARALRLAALVFFMAFAFWEFFTPFNLFGEPLPLLALETLFWCIIALSEAFAIAAVMESHALGKRLLR